MIYFMMMVSTLIHNTLRPLHHVKDAYCDSPTWQRKYSTYPAGVPNRVTQQEVARRGDRHEELWYNMTDADAASGGVKNIQCNTCMKNWTSTKSTSNILKNSEQNCENVSQILKITNFQIFFIFEYISNFRNSIFQKLQMFTILKNF